MKSIAPSVFIVGAPKCGTTSLAGYLDHHPHVQMSVPKEPNYFSTDFPELMEVQTVDEYLSLFATESNEISVTGEASTWYLYSRCAISNILDFQPHAKFIVMLRNPHDMFLSLHAQFRYNLMEEIEDPRDAWFAQNEKKNRQMKYKSVCSLGQQVQRLLSQCDREKVHFVLFDDLKENPSAEYEKVLSFLNLEPHQADDYSPKNARKTHRSRRLENVLRYPPDAANKLLALFKKITGVRQIGLSKLILRWNIKPLRNEHLDPDFSNKLTSEFREDIVLLQDIIDRDLSVWLANR